MLRSLSNWQKGVIFYVLTLIMAVAVVIFGPDSDGQLQILNMLTPTVGVLLLLLVVTPDGYHRSGWAGLALHRPGWRAWPLALIAPTAILVSYGAAWLVGVLSWNFESDILHQLDHRDHDQLGLRDIRGDRLAGIPAAALRCARQLRCGFLVGFLHGVWHLPLMLMTTAYNPAGNRLITVPIFLAVLTGAGVIYAYLRWTSGSIWPVIIAHGTFNAVLGAFAGAAVIPDAAAAAYLTGETGLFTFAGVAITAFVLARRYRSVRSTESDERRHTDWRTPGLKPALEAVTGDLSPRQPRVTGQANAIRGHIPPGFAAGSCCT